MSQTIFDLVMEHARDTSRLEGALALLEWDEHTYIPPSGGAFRAEQVSLLSGLIHQRRTNDQLGEWLRQLAGSPLANDRHQPVGAAIAGWLRDYEKHVKLPQRLVEEMAKATSLGQQAWVTARSADRWQDFEPHLNTIVGLKREEAQLLAEDGQLYDALLDQYEEGAKSADVAIMFANLRDELVALLADLSDRGTAPSGQTWKRPIGLPMQRDASQWIASQIGYSFERGRLDETAHPFCTTLGPSDCRILTRYLENNFASGFYSTLHEAGHGMYEQGLPDHWYGTPPGSAASLGVHESQSRLWENFVGRSQSFWKWCFPQLQQKFGAAWQGLDWMQAFRDANRVERSLIRVEADEVTYNLHILIRFELEQELITGQLQVHDAPQAWNDRYERYLGIKPNSDRDGILQDVHWSAGLMGYFPTYTLGNLYAAQLMEAISLQLGNVDELLAVGEFRGILQWLRDKIHVHGRCLPPAELIKQASGQALSAKPLVAYLRKKLEVAYSMI